LINLGITTWWRGAPVFLSMLRWSFTKTEIASSA
jgi:hypothetical protein